MPALRKGSGVCVREPPGWLPHEAASKRGGCNPGVSLATSANFDQGLPPASVTGWVWVVFCCFVFFFLLLGCFFFPFSSHLFPKCEEPEATLETLSQLRIPLHQSQGQDNRTLMLLTYWFRVSLFPFPSTRTEHRAAASPCLIS